MDECDGFDLFSKKEIAGTKRLFEGSGKIINNKNKHAFRAFKNCYTFITMNNLPYPFDELKADATDTEKYNKRNDEGAFNARMKRVQLTKPYKNVDKFPLSLT